MPLQTDTPLGHREVWGVHGGEAVPAPGRHSLYTAQAIYDAASQLCAKKNAAWKFSSQAPCTLWPARLRPFAGPRPASAPGVASVVLTLAQGDGKSNSFVGLNHRQEPALGAQPPASLITGAASCIPGARRSLRVSGQGSVGEWRLLWGHSLSPLGSCNTRSRGPDCWQDSHSTWEHMAVCDHLIFFKDLFIGWLRGSLG